MATNDDAALRNGIKVALFGELHNVLNGLEVEAANLSSMFQVGGPDDHGDLSRVRNHSRPIFVLFRQLHRRPVHDAVEIDGGQGAVFQIITFAAVGVAVF